METCVHPAQLRLRIERSCVIARYSISVPS